MFRSKWKTHINRKQSILKGENVIEKPYISKEYTTACLLQTTKANRGLMGLDVGTGACVGLSSPWRLVFQPSAAVGGPSSQFRHPLTSPLNAGSIHLSRLGAWLYIDGGVYKVRQAYDCPAGLKIDLSHDKSNLSLTDDPNWIADKLRKTSSKTSNLNITRHRNGRWEVIGPFHIG